TKAIKLLGENDYNITEIAEHCGFSDTKYFSRMIKKKFNLSPRTLRQKLKM
ncbi:MAG: helix-turn-helix transcriptional regulator, partial [Firmicutes bacterium]|nr:helix-turn-helix transcriptional regulator [Bacillota bacterium]